VPQNVPWLISGHVERRPAASVAAEVSLTSESGVSRRLLHGVIVEVMLYLTRRCEYRARDVTYLDIRS
jgi:hypothetical protein